MPASGAFPPPAAWDLYLVTDRAASRRTPLEDACLAAENGVRAVQYREKERPWRARVTEARAMARACRARGAAFIVNDSVPLALAAGADGVHLGKDDAPVEEARALLPEGAVIGATVRSASEAVAAEKAGASYVSIGPVYATATKPDAPAPCGPQAIADIKKRVHVPVVCIGGITEHNLARVLAFQPDAVAMASGLVARCDLAGAVKRIRRVIQAKRRNPA